MKPTIRVVAAALFDSLGRVLIAQRPPGKPMAGRWEFPGGKIHSGESEHAALERELREELGVDVIRAERLLELRHEYAERHVELCMWLVGEYRGMPAPLDGQALKWVMPADLAQEDLLEADRPIVQALAPMNAPARPATVRVRNPRTGDYDFKFEPPSDAELAQIARRLRAAQRGWAARSIDARAQVLQQWRAALLAARDEIAAALTADTGRRLLSIGEVNSVAAAIERWCVDAPAMIKDETGRSRAAPAIEFHSQWVAYPLVGVVSPWNFPLLLALIDAIPALLAGCAVLIKPSEVTPRFIAPLRRSIAAVPELAAVFEVVAGTAATGAALVDLCDAICFTGSIATGRQVAQDAARRLIPAFLELGGKDPVIITASADVDRAAAAVLRASVQGTGQACQSLERIYVHESRHDAFVRRLVELAQEVEINFPDPARGVLGPFILERQATIVADQIADAVALGARVLCGGQIETHGGKWLRATVLCDVTHRMKVMTEETFGPVMPVMKYASVDEAVALANDGIYGLSAAVIAGTVAEAEGIALRLEAGAVSINDGALTALMQEVEKNSFKQSGLGGSRMGASGYTRFFRRKALIVQTGTPASIEIFDESNLKGPVTP